MDISAFSPADEYDKALVFALKKWISDEIYSITDTGVKQCHVCLTVTEESFKVYFEYETDKSPESRRAGLLDDNAAVSGSADIWLRFKGYDVSDPRAADNFAACVNEAVRRLEADGIIKERFNRSIPISSPEISEN